MRAPLPVRLLVPVSLALFTTALTVIGIVLDRNTSFRDFEAETLESSSSFARIAAPDIAHALTDGRTADVADTVRRLSSEPRVSFVMVADADDRPLHVGARDGLDAAAASQHLRNAALPVARARASGETAAALTPDRGAILVASPLRWPPERESARASQAVLVAGFELTASKRVLFAELVRRSAAIGFVALIACVAVWAYLRRIFTSQLDRVVSSVAAFARTGVEPELSAAGPGELVQIGESMRALLAQLKHEHARLRESEEKFARIFDAAPVLISVSEIETGRFIDMNEAAVRLTGYTREETIGRTSVDLGWLRQSDRARLLEILERDGKIEGVEVTVFRKDGGGLDCLLFAQVVPIDGVPRLLVICQDLTAYKQAQAAALAAERQYRQLLDMAPLPVAIARQGLVQYTNLAFARMYGRSDPREFIGESVGARVAPEAREAFLARAGLRLEGQPVEQGYETIGIRRDGERFPVLVTASLVPLSDGQAVIGFFQDVSAQRDAETRLRDSETRFRLLFDHAADAIFIHDRDGRLVDVNQAAIDSVGYTREELLRMSVLDLGCSHADLPAVWAALKEGQGATAVGRHRRRDGSTFPVEVHASLFVDRGRALIFAASRDISARLATEEQLRDSEARFRAVVENSHDGITFTDDRGTIIYRSPAFVAINGFDMDERVGHDGFEMIHPDDLSRVRETWARMLTEPGGVQTAEYRAKHKDGTWRWFDTSARNLLANPNVRAVVVTTRDITERKRAYAERESLQAQLAQSQKIEAVGRLAGGVAHDFNNMLSVILGFAELALAETDDGHPLRDDLLEIRRAAERSVDLTRQLLAFARQQPVTPRVVDLNSAVQDMLSMLRRLIGENITLTWRPGDGLPTILIDPSQIDQILANLCVNARDAIGGVGRVTIETAVAELDEASAASRPGAKPGTYVCLSVHDSGRGMSADVIEHIFEPFFTTKGVGKGTGLGLATVYGVVSQNGGFIDVQSREGEGSRFFIYLPAPVAGGSEPSAPVATDSPSGVRGTVLLVEDERAVLALTQRVLEHLGYRVIPAPSPTEALALAEAHGSEIVLLMTDVIMPEMNGRELAAAVRHRLPHVRCLFTSGYTADVIADHGVLEEGTLLLRKPWTKQALEAKVRQALGSEPPPAGTTTM